MAEIRGYAINMFYIEHIYFFSLKMLENKELKMVILRKYVKMLQKERQITLILYWDKNIFIRGVLVRVTYKHVWNEMFL